MRRKGESWSAYYRRKGRGTDWSVLYFIFIVIALLIGLKLVALFIAAVPQEIVRW